MLRCFFGDGVSGPAARCSARFFFGVDGSGGILAATGGGGGAALLFFWFFFDALSASFAAFVAAFAAALSAFSRSFAAAFSAFSRSFAAAFSASFARAASFDAMNTASSSPERSSIELTSVVRASV